MHIETYGDMLIAFQKRRQKRPYELSLSAAILWYQLAYLFYRAKGKPFHANNREIGKKAGLTVITIWKTKNELIEKGYLQYRRQYRGGIYGIVWPDEIDLIKEAK